jgi:hypothetical protein
MQRYEKCGESQSSCYDDHQGENGGIFSEKNRKKDCK